MQMWRVYLWQDLSTDDATAELLRAVIAIDLPDDVARRPTTPAE